MTLIFLGKTFPWTFYEKPTVPHETVSLMHFPYDFPAYTFSEELFFNYLIVITQIWISESIWDSVKNH